MGKSSKDKRDLYYRKAKEEGWRARSAFKLLQLDSQFHLLNHNYGNDTNIPLSTSDADGDLEEKIQKEEEEEVNNSSPIYEEKSLTRVVDLCAAPGSWSQVLSKRMYEEYEVKRKQYQEAKEKNPNQSTTKLIPPQEPKIVAVDLQPMAPIPGVITLQADITHPRTITKILSEFGGEPAELVISDGAPDVTGLHDLDEYIQAQLIYSALQLATALLRPGDGAFVAKIFRGRDIDLLYAQMGRLFEHVSCAKPRSSRASSLESFIVCQGYRPRDGWDPRAQLGWKPNSNNTNNNNEDSSEAIAKMSTQEFCQSTLQSVPRLEKGDSLPTASTNFSNSNDENYNTSSTSSSSSSSFSYTYFEEPRVVAPFVACGDLSAYDSDATYTLDPKFAKLSLDPVQSPTAPPYKRALEMKRKGLISRTN